MSDKISKDYLIFLSISFLPLLNLHVYELLNIFEIHNCTRILLYVNCNTFEYYSFDVRLLGTTNLLVEISWCEALQKVL